MAPHRVVVTGIAGISPIGNDWNAIRHHLGTYLNAVRFMEGWDAYADLNTKLGARAAPFEIPNYPSFENLSDMGMVSKMAVRTTELALADAGLLHDTILKSGKLGIAFGSCSGAPEGFIDVWKTMEDKSTKAMDSSTYFKILPHTTTISIASTFGITGRVITTSSACTSSSQAIGYAYETIKHGRQVAMVAGGAEELHAIQAAVFDTLFATSTKNAAPSTTPSPFDINRDGLVLGEGSCSLILEEYEHALARGAKIYAEIVGFGTNSDGCHVTNPNQPTMKMAMQLALDDAGLDSQSIGYINAHGTATEKGDIAETGATFEIFGGNVPISSLKSYTGHTLGACGGLESWVTIEMMREGWFAPTLNLTKVDPLCGDLDYIVGSAREFQCEYAMSNNFAFGGINTSLIFRKIL